jgi:hypothetical protein
MKKDRHLNDDQDWFLTTRRPPVWTAVRGFRTALTRKIRAWLPPNGAHMSDADATVTRARD